MVFSSLLMLRCLSLPASRRCNFIPLRCFVQALTLGAAAANRPTTAAVNRMRQEELKEDDDEHEEEEDDGGVGRRYMWRL